MNRIDLFDQLRAILSAATDEEIYEIIDFIEDNYEAK